MVIVNHIKNPLHLYDTLYNHNHKFILFDTDKIFSRINYTYLLEGAICASPDSGNKWTIYQDGKKPFQFFGRTMTISNISIDEFKAKPRFKYLLRDTIHWL